MEKNKKHNGSDYFLADWSAGKISTEELKKYISEEDFEEFVRLEKGIQLFEKLEAPLDNSYKNIKTTIQKKKESKVRKLQIQWIASIAASIVLFVSLYNMFGNNSTLYSTTIGEQKNIALLDDSEVVLNSKSEISYSKKTWKKKREVLLKGEAFFKVKKGSTFTVNTNSGSITVLGTQFNVISRNEFFEVVCYEGKVKVEKDMSKFILLPGNSVRILNGKVIENHGIKENLPTWISGESTFSSVPLKYVINALENKFDIKFDRSSIDESVIYTGSFNNKNLKIALATVFKATGIKYKMTESKIILLENN